MANTWYVVGLGNPGTDYAQTRHNAGRWVVEAWATQLLGQPLEQSVVMGGQATSTLNWKAMKKLQANILKVDVTAGPHAGESWVFIEPETFMNESGLAVRAVLDYFEHFDQMSLPAQAALLRRLVVVHDDLDLELGKHKLQLGKGPKVHNGLLSLYQHLGSQNFWHGRVGVDSRGGTRHQSAREYVLQGLSSAEKSQWFTGVNDLVNQWQTRLRQT